MEEPPGRFGFPQHRGVLLWQLHALLLKRVDARPLLAPRLERRKAGGLHPPLLDERPNATDVDLAPGAPRPTRRESDGVALSAQASPHAIDPPVTEGLVD